MLSFQKDSFVSIQCNCPDKALTKEDIVVLLIQAFVTVTLPEDYRQGTLEEYHVRRITNGVPEGIDDFIAGTSLPLEYNLDYMHGGMPSLITDNTPTMVAETKHPHALLLSSL